MKLLANRIQHLQVAEERARRKIAETKARTTEIVGLKRRNLEFQESKQRLHQERELSVSALQRSTSLARVQNREHVQSSRSAAERRRGTVASTCKHKMAALNARHERDEHARVSRNRDLNRKALDERREHQRKKAQRKADLERRVKAERGRGAESFSPSNFRPNRRRRAAAAATRRPLWRIAQRCRDVAISPANRTAMPRRGDLSGESRRRRGRDVEISRRRVAGSRDWRPGLDRGGPRRDSGAASDGGRRPAVGGAWQVDEIPAPRQVRAAGRARVVARAGGAAPHPRDDAARGAPHGLAARNAERPDQGLRGPPEHAEAVV